MRRPKTAGEWLHLLAWGVVTAPALLIVGLVAVILIVAIAVTLTCNGVIAIILATINVLSPWVKANVEKETSQGPKPD